jgi:hypothetical protein
VSDKTKQPQRRQLSGDSELLCMNAIAEAMDAALEEAAALTPAAQARVSAWFRSRYGSPPQLAAPPVGPATGSEGETD